MRCDNKVLGRARSVILQGDQRFNSINKDTIIRKTFLAQGFPFQISLDALITAVKSGTGQPAIPLRSFRIGGLITWVLGFQDEPNCNKFAIKSNDQVHEVILTPQLFAKPTLSSSRRTCQGKKPNQNRRLNPATPGTPSLCRMPCSHPRPKTRRGCNCWNPRLLIWKPTSQNWLNAWMDALIRWPPSSHKCCKLWLLHPMHPGIQQGQGLKDPRGTRLPLRPVGAIEPCAPGEADRDVVFRLIFSACNRHVSCLAIVH